ncbi:MAG: cellulase family glycosylhydrolase [Thermoleophilia bacterium]|nr:cellulase family glycosylhydrolase [Thermoleophilia bacterium]
MRTRLAAIAAALALIPLVAGCSDSSNSEVPRSTATGPQPLPLTDEGLPPALAVQDDRLVNANADPAERTAMVAQTGAKVTRVDLFWKDVAPARPADPTDPADPAYDWTRMDAILTGFAAAGISPIVDVFNAPAWATGGTTTVGPLTPYNSVPPDPAAFAEFMRAASTRYSGTFTAGGAALPKVTHWELWNEPNLKLFMHPAGGTQRWIDTYAAMVKAAYPAVKAGGGAGTVVLVGAAGPRSRTGANAVGARDWLVGLRRRDVPLDVYSQHIYPAAAPREVTPAVPAWGTLDVLLDELETWRPDLGIAITEAGYTTAETPYRKTFVSEEAQAANLRDILAMPAVRDPRVRVVVWFNLQDNPNWPAGLLREDGSQKPSYGVFTELAGERQRGL